MPAAVFASYLLGESAEHLTNAGAEQLFDKVHLRYWWFESTPLPQPLHNRKLFV